MKCSTANINQSFRLYRVITDALFKTTSSITVQQNSLRHYFIMTNYQEKLPQNNQYQLSYSQYFHYYDTHTHAHPIQSVFFPNTKTVPHKG
jgi:hypothetical protein